MKNVDKWKPSRYIVVEDKLRASTNTHELALSSRLYVGLNAQAYNDHFHKYCRGRLLDLGCGKVPFYEFYREHVHDVVCVDWGGTLHGGVHVDIQCDLTERLPFNDQEFDTVLLSDVLEHIPTPQQLIDEIARVLRHDGNHILNVPFVYPLHEAPYDFFRYTRYALERMANEAGLEVSVLQPYGDTTTVVADAIAKRSVSIPLLGNSIAAIVQGMARIALAVKRSLKGRDGSQTLSPSMYFLVARKKSSIT